MKNFRVWAPLANSVELILQGKPLKMKRERRGDWWSATASPAPAGSDYWFKVNGKGPYPDPRSPWQPKGVHGPSCVVDHDSFDWGEKTFAQVPLDQAVIYELHIGTFTPEGTYRA